MSTIFKTRISQQEVQTPVVSADTVVTDNFIASSFQSESVSSEEVLADLVSAVTIESDEVFATDTNTTNLVVTNDFSPGGDVIVSSGNVLVSKGGTVSFLDDGEIVEEDGATGFPVFSGIPEILNNGTIYNIGLIDKDTELSGIHFGGSDDIVQTCEIWFATGSDVYNIIWPSDFVWLDSMDGNAPAIVVNTEYRVALRKEKDGATVASIAYALGEGRMIIGESEPYELTAEAIQEVVPMVWGNNEISPSANSIHSIAIGNNAKAAGWASTALGTSANAEKNACIAIGHSVSALGTDTITIGNGAQSERPYSLAIGTYATVKKTGNGEYDGACAITLGTRFSDTSGSYTCSTQGTGSITIGAGANTLNNGDTESSNSVTIGCKAENKGADSVVIGASASGRGGVIIGAGSVGDDYNSIAIGLKATADRSGIAIGENAYAPYTSVMIGSSTKGGGVVVGFCAQAYNNGVAVGMNSFGNSGGTSVGNSAFSTGKGAAFGHSAKSNDAGVVVFASWGENSTKTQLYLAGANTPLANTYEDGEAMMGYVVQDSAGNVMTDAEGNAMVGTQKLSVLFPNNRGENAFTPAMLGLDDEWTPKPMFRPSDLDMPVEEPTEPEEYQPLPVYPIVEPEIEEI